MRKPANLTHVEAAALPLAGLTAWQALVDTANVRAGQRVLVHGAAGGVGHLAVQIARSKGAYVIGTASAGKHESVRGLGASEVVDYTAVDFADVLGDLDVVIDTVGGDYGPRSLRTLKPGGILVSLTAPGEAHLAERARAAGRRAVFMIVEADHAGMRAIAELAGTWQLSAEVEHTLPLELVGKAHELSESRRTTGKIVLVP